jgi:hypothetical protein
MVTEYDTAEGEILRYQVGLFIKHFWLLPSNLILKR